MKHICFFSGDITRSGGTERVALQIASELSKMNNQYEITIISLMETNKAPFYTIPHTIRRHTILSKVISPINKAIYKFPYILFKLVSLLKQNEIDIVIDVDGILDVFSLPAKCFSKVKLITWEHFNFYTDLGNRYRTYLKRASARFSDYIIVLTEEDKSYYQQNLKLKCPIEFIYNPIDMTTDASYDIASKTILSAGRLNTQKGFDMLIDVANVVFKKHPDWSWIIAGDGEEKEALKKKINEYGLESHIHLVGNVKNIDDYYRNAGIFVLTSRFEGFGLVITEAKKHRLPVVSFKCKAGPGELILDQHNGFLINCFDLNDMASKINILIENEQLRQSFSDKSHDDTEKFKYTNILKKWVAVLNSLSGLK